MALVLSDRIKVRSTSTGTGSFVLGNAVQGFQDFSVIGDGNETFYGIVDALGNWEVGKATYTSAGNILSRDQVVESSNNGNLVDFAGGSKNVLCTFPSSLAPTLLTSVAGQITGDLRGSVFADNSTLLVNGIEGTISYYPANASDWSGTPPSTVNEALDRLANLVKTLNSGTGA